MRVRYAIGNLVFEKWSDIDDMKGILVLIAIIGCLLVVCSVLMTTIDCIWGR